MSSANSVCEDAISSPLRSLEDFDILVRFFVGHARMRRSDKLAVIGRQIRQVRHAELVATTPRGYWPVGGGDEEEARDFVGSGDHQAR